MDKLSAEDVGAISLEVTSAPPREVNASATFKLNARVTNASNKVLYSVPPCPVRLAYHWIEKTTRQMVVLDGNRSGLFPGADPNTSQSYPLTILAPAEAGEYVLQITMVQEGVCWFESIRPEILQEFAVFVV
jgi:hypothetical protein